MVRIHAALLVAFARGSCYDGSCHSDAVFVWHIAAQKYSEKEHMIMAKTRNGTVKWFSARRGYGFITDEDGVDYFAHFSQIQQEGFKKLSAGQEVTFEAGEDGKGRSLANSIVPISEEETEVSEE